MRLALGRGIAVDFLQAQDIGLQPGDLRSQDFQPLGQRNRGIRPGVEIFQIERGYANLHRERFPADPIVYHSLSRPAPPRPNRLHLDDALLESLRLGRKEQSMKLIAGNSNRPLAEAISAYLNVPLTKASIRRFSDMEVFVEVEENIRGEDVFVVQSTSFPANDNLMELLVILDALRRASARRVTAVVPYYGYARQDRKTGPRTPISAKLVANLITTAGAQRLLTIDLHAGQIQGFFDIPVDNLIAAPVFTKSIEDRYGNGAGNGASDVVIVSPDVGGVVRARAIASRIGADLAIIDKRRPKAGVSEVMNIIGEVDGRACILVDDIVDSAGTLCNAAVALTNEGAKSVSAYVTHGVLSGGAVGRVAASPLEALVITDSIQATEAVRVSDKVQPQSIAPLLGEAIRRISDESSVSSLFD